MSGDVLQLDANSQSPREPARPPNPARPGERKIQGLDSIRFWCALWVYFSHFGFIPLPAGWALPRVVAGIYNNLFCGVAAVITFFVISGFCIHYPYITTQKFSLGPFYARRYVRILPPLLAALLLARLLGQNLVNFYATIIWSLIAELIYYSIYPALRPALARWPRELLLLSYLASAAIILTHSAHLDFHQSGFRLTWLVGLPSWLLGCRLAAFAAADASRSTKSPWAWRGAVWAASSVASMLRFHAHIGYPPTLTLFGVLVFFWLRAELRYYRFARPPVYTEFSGSWSYSIYLVHGLAALAFGLLGIKGGAIPLWTLQTIAVLAGSFAFYLAVELPSHRLARYLARLVLRLETPAVARSRALPQQP